MWTQFAPSPQKWTRMRSSCKPHCSQGQSRSKSRPSPSVWKAPKVRAQSHKCCHHLRDRIHKAATHLIYTHQSLLRCSTNIESCSRMCDCTRVQGEHKNTTPPATQSPYTTSRVLPASSWQHHNAGHEPVTCQRNEITNKKWMEWGSLPLQICWCHRFWRLS